MIGDSISMPVPFTPGGYGVNAREMLEARNISAFHAGGWGHGGQVRLLRTVCAVAVAVAVLRLRLRLRLTML